MTNLSSMGCSDDIESWVVLYIAIQRGCTREEAEDAYFGTNSKPMNKSPWTEADINQLVELFNSGMKFDEMARQMGRSVTSLWTMAKVVRKQGRIGRRTK